MKSSTANLGHQMFASPAGLTSQNHLKRLPPLNKVRQQAKMANDSVPPQRLLFSFILIFASFNASFTVASHNLHGFKKSSSFHKKCIENHAGVWFAQELWLQESQLTQLNELGVNFTAASGMEKSVSSGILRGRPYGGVA